MVLDTSQRAPSRGEGERHICCTVLSLWRSLWTTLPSLKTRESNVRKYTRDTQLIAVLGKYLRRDTRITLSNCKAGVDLKLVSSK
jgi:hypothetical protein